MKQALTTLLFLLSALTLSAEGWIRINQLGYQPQATKVAVYMGDRAPEHFRLVDALTGEVVFTGVAKPTGPLGQMAATARLDFSSFGREGAYRIEAEGAVSESFPIGPGVYDGVADFVLNYMRQQRCGWNPFLKDSCHVKDAIIVNHPTKSGQYLDVRGGWHDASDCLQYTATTANAVYQMAYAYEQNSDAFGDFYATDGTPGSNGIPDIVDEIRWGLDWLDRMNPEPGRPRPRGDAQASAGPGRLWLGARQLSARLLLHRNAPAAGKTGRQECLHGPGQHHRQICIGLYHRQPRTGSLLSGTGDPHQGEGPGCLEDRRGASRRIADGIHREPLHL